MRLISCLLEFLFPSRASERLVREATIETIGLHMQPRTNSEDLISLLPYHVPLIQALIVEAKFRNNERAHKLLGAVLAEYLQGWCEEHAVLDEQPVTLVPLPLSRTRHRERGYNQSERIVRATRTRVPFVHSSVHALARVRDTAPQTSLGGEARRKNLIDAFVARDIDPTHTYIVIDDVMTTGATLESAMNALKIAGAKRVIGLSLAH